MNVTQLWPQVDDDAPELTRWALAVALVTVALVVLVLAGTGGLHRQCQSLRHSDPARATQVCGSADQ